MLTIKTRFSLLRQVLFVLMTLSLFSCHLVTPQEEVNTSHNTNREANSKSQTYLLVHGAWHPQECWHLVKEKLEQQGHNVFTVQLQGLGKDQTPLEQITLQSHVDAVKLALNQIEGKVVLVGHSYGGVVISQVGEQLPQKIEKLVYLSAFMLQNGESLADIALKDTLSVVTQNLVFAPPAAFIPKEKYISAFYNEVEENNNQVVEQEVNELMALLRPHPIAALGTPISIGANYNSLDKVYISCLKDHAITPSAQQFMYSRFNGVKVFTLKADHSPFITQTSQLVNILGKL
ncbi:alpha/beta fold hydrolase [Sporocytophaga myxococcoides]|uniref:alpha/beta fold hydrolase n=1 Tax=Sporocytophaga myxococcoides TaxID=153721 RepID=UPI0009DBBE17|nr:alpha/beta fold hydrolase [Sporocytophaga myxococcoides]